MFPVGKGIGQIWYRGQFVCETEYDIEEPLRVGGRIPVQRIVLKASDHAYAELSNHYGLVLVLADGTRHNIPRPLVNRRLGYLECFITM